MKFKKVISILLASSTILISGVFSNTVRAVNYTRVGVHDPSIVKLDDGSYYIIGSHLAAARSDDLFSWTYTADSNLGTKNTTFFHDIYTDLAVPEKWSNTTDGYDLSGNLWAPDIIYNETMGKYCMYLSVNGENWASSIVLCTAEEIDGPYTYQGTIVYSGFTNGTKNNVNDTDVPKVLGENPDISRYLSNDSWNAAYGTNAIDPAVFYDESGKLWMIYGSWFGGLFMLELDENTGLRDYTVQYETTANVSDAYMGKKAAGGNFSSGEGPYIRYIESPNSNKGYYYLFTSYGYFNANGGYNMRIFRSENPDGPYVDQNGNSAIYTKGAGDTNTGGTVGERLMSNYQWNCNDRPFKAQGHNSVLVDDDGKLYVIYHTKFDDAYGFHEVRVHQMFVNQDGWLTAAPYEYSGETISAVGHTTKAVAGTYEFIFHTLHQTFVNEKSADVEKSKSITLCEDGTVTGDVSGTWAMEKGTPYMTFTCDGVVYRGEFLVQADESAAQIPKMTFTATGNNTCVWGSKEEAYQANEDMVDLTSYGSQLTYNPIVTSFEKNGSVIGDTKFLSDISYMIENKFSGKVLDLAEGKTNAGTNIQQWTKTGGSQQEWRICDLGNGYCKIVSMADESMVVTVNGTDDANGLNIQIEKYTGADQQQWKLVQNGLYYGIVSKCTGDKAGLDVYDWSAENGGNINQWEYWGGDCQLWKITPVYPEVIKSTYLIRNVNSGLFLGKNGENVEQSAEGVVWSVVKNEDATFSILDEEEKAVTIEKADAVDGNNALMADDMQNSNQKFQIQPCKDGSYVMLSVCSDGKSALDVYEISMEHGANICQWNYWGGSGQKWVLIPTAAPVKTVIGDVNADGKLTIADVVMLQKWLLHDGELTDWKAGDLQADGVINGFDLCVLRKLLLESIA